MADRLHITRPSLSAEKVLLIPRTTRRSFSIAKQLTAARLLTSARLPASARSPLNIDPSAQLPVHNYSFIARSSHQLQSANAPSFHYSPARLKRVQSFRLATEGILEGTGSRSKEEGVLRDALVIRPLGRAQEELPARSGKPRSSFLEFFKSRKRSVKAVQPQGHIEGSLLRFLQVRRSKMAPC
jgi:hypothetical protein